MNLEQLCQEYVINIYNTIHEGDINYKLALASERRDLHNLILAKLGLDRTPGIQDITDNLDRLNDNGKSFDVDKKHTISKLKAVGQYGIDTNSNLCYHYDKISYRRG